MNPFEFVGVDYGPCTSCRNRYRVYEIDPLICPRCDAKMRVIAVIHDAGVIRQILEHLKLWNPRPAARRTIRRIHRIGR